MMVRRLPPNGWGADAPGMLARCRPHPEQHQVGQFVDVAGLAGHDQEGDRHTAGVEPHDKGREVPGGK